MSGVSSRLPQSALPFNVQEKPDKSWYDTAYGRLSSAG